MSQAFGMQRFALGFKAGAFHSHHCFALIDLRITLIADYIVSFRLRPQFMPTMFNAAILHLGMGAKAFTRCFELSALFFKLASLLLEASHFRLEPLSLR